LAGSYRAEDDRFEPGALSLNLAFPQTPVT